jgi:hypothetical protein
MRTGFQNPQLEHSAQREQAVVAATDPAHDSTVQNLHRLVTATKAANITVCGRLSGKGQCVTFCVFERGLGLGDYNTHAVKEAF